MSERKRRRIEIEFVIVKCGKCKETCNDINEVYKHFNCENTSNWITYTDENGKNLFKLLFGYYKDNMR